jgi:hypothetical protein
MTRVLLLGVPRSGTTWCGRVLGRTAGAGGGRSRSAMARIARHLDAGAAPADRFRAWFGEGTTARLRVVRALARPMVAVPEARHVVVKTVRAEFTAEWIADRFGPTVVLVERNPLNVLASWIDLGYALEPREFRAYVDHATRRGIAAPERTDAIERQTFTYAVMATALRDAADRAGWLRTTHEHLCVDSTERFAALAADLGLEWSGDAARFVHESDREGTGYRTERRTAEQPDRWRDRLDADQVGRIRSVLERFPGLEVPAP